MTQNKNTSLNNYQHFSVTANKNWSLPQLYQHIESIKLREQKEPLTPLEKTCLKGLLCGYSPEMISQELSDKLDYYSVQIIFWTLYRYIKTMTGRSDKEITNQQDVIDSLEASGYKAENADTILIDINTNASLVIPQTFQPHQSDLKQVINSASNVTLPQSTSKRLAYLNLRLLILMLSGLLIFLLTPPGRRWISKIPILSNFKFNEAATAQNSSSNTILPVEEAATTQNPSSNTILPVETVKVNLVDSYQVDRIYTGTIVPRRISSIGFERTGRLLNLNVNQGDRVTVGTSIAQLDTKKLNAQQQELIAERKQANAMLEELQAGPRSEIIAAAQSNVKSRQSQLTLAKTKSKRRQKLYAVGAISREQLDQVTTEAKILQARLNEAQSRLDELLAGTRSEKIAAQQALIQQLDAKLASMELELEQSTLKAPFTGIISERFVDKGTVVSAGEPILSIVDVQTLDVHVGLPVKAATQVSIGSNQQLKIGYKNYQAQVLSTLPQLNSATRTLTIILRLDESIATEVRAGQIARLNLSETIADSGYWLPTTALVRGVRGLWSCYVLGNAEIVVNDPKKAFRVERREIEILQTESDRVFVRGTIQNSDRVIVNGNHRLVNGQLVHPIEHL